MTGPPKYTDGKDLLNGGMTGCSRADGACCVVFYKGSATKTKKKTTDDISTTTKNNDSEEEEEEWKGGHFPMFFFLLVRVSGIDFFCCADFCGNIQGAGNRFFVFLGFVFLVDFLRIGIPWDSSPSFATIWENLFWVTFLFCQKRQANPKFFV